MSVPEKIQTPEPCNTGQATKLWKNLAKLGQFLTKKSEVLM